MSFKVLLLLTVMAAASLWQPVASHGRFTSPPARGSMWRFGYDTPKNYQDHQLFCGGFQHQLNLGYKCGTCGDPYDQQPRPHEAGGKYATGQIVATYKQGQPVTFRVDLTANHKGWFEFKICPTNDFQIKATQQCLDKNVLQLADGSGTKLHVADFGSRKIDIDLVLPGNLSCQFCVVQWRYHCGNNWGKDDVTGEEGVGFGPQEEFYGCADIQILASSTSGSSSPAMTTLPTTPTDSSETNTTPPPGTSTSRPIVKPKRPFIKECWSANENTPDLAPFCTLTCNLGFCPVTHCTCQSVPDPRYREDMLPGCYATTPFYTKMSLDTWCAAANGLGHCPRDTCFYVPPTN